MTIGHAKHLFPGGNTPWGFVSYFQYIIEPQATRLFILKGSPGAGKSTFMKKIGNALLDLGYDVEFHHCSSDPDSLDGIMVPALQVAVIDGTAPHVVDPQYPGCFDEIINLGQFWDQDRLVAHKDEIIRLHTAIARLFQRAYRLLKAARLLYEDWEQTNSQSLDLTYANRIAKELILTVFAGVTSTGSGKLRKLFASAITPRGLVHYLDSILAPVSRCYVITGDPGTGRSTLLQKVIDCALAKGLDVEAYYCPFDPLKPEHVIIPALDIALTVSAPPHIYPLVKAHRYIDMNAAVNQQSIANHAAANEYNQTMYKNLLNQAILNIKQAKELHDVLESFYTPTFDFKGIEQLCEQTLDRILRHSKQ